MKKPADKVIPALMIGEQIAAVEHNELIGIRTEQLHHFQPENAGPGHGSVLVIPLAHQADGVAHEGEGVAN